MIDLSDVKGIVAGDKITDMLRKYKFVTGALYNTDASDDYTYQDAYCDLYRLGDAYSEKFKVQFFVLLEKMKNMSNISFKEAFETLQAVENKNEMTAASILVHTINPRFAIWDEQLASEFFKIQIPEDNDSVERFCKRYEDFSELFYAFTNSPEGDKIVKAFDERFPSAEIPDVIKVGFVICVVEDLKK